MTFQIKNSVTSPYHFVVEGNIGVGKSTFVKLMQAQLGFHGVFEPCNRWQEVGGAGNLLEQFYTNPTRWAYTFQTYAFVTRILEHKEQAQRSTSPVHLLERSVFSDRYVFAKYCFELGYMNTLEWKLYQEWFAWLVDTYMTKPTGFIYLRTTPEICMARMALRNRHEEQQVPRSYIEGIHEKHEGWLIRQEGIMATMKDIPVLVLACDKDFEKDVSVQQEHAHKVQEFVNTYTGIKTHVHRQVSLTL